MYLLIICGRLEKPGKMKIKRSHVIDAFMKQQRLFPKSYVYNEMCSAKKKQTIVA